MFPTYTKIGPNKIYLRKSSSGKMRLLYTDHDDQIKTLTMETLCKWLDERCELRSPLGHKTLAACGLIFDAARKYKLDLDGVMYKDSNYIFFTHGGYHHGKSGSQSTFCAEKNELGLFVRNIPPEDVYTQLKSMSKILA